jgi:hypothetical protein
MNMRMSVSKISLRHLLASEHVDSDISASSDYLRVCLLIPDLPALNREHA